MACPASLGAEIEDEPLPPAGIDPATLPPEVSRFLFTAWVPWARGNTLRLQQAKAWCAAEAGR